MDHTHNLINNLDLLDLLITYYFYLGLQHKEIILFLFKFHKLNLSEKTLKRHLNRMHLYRRKKYTNVESVISFLEQELQGSGQLHGYRWMHLRCIQNGFVVKQQTVRHLLQILDPVGLNIRKRKRLRRRVYSNFGPNFLWHIDSYDKLKPYGICVNGCIDGFSRHIIWLKAARTNSNPKVIAGYYIEVLKKLRGCPQTVRTDMGTENVYLENMQVFLRQLNGRNRGTMPPFLYGTSQSNQRIESWWAILRKHNTQYWMNIFGILKDDGLFDGSFLDKSLLQFCFLHIIQKELDLVVQEWNTHRITRSRNSISPSGRPIQMYNFPELYDCENHLVQVTNEHIQACEEECLYLKGPCDEDINDLCNLIMSEIGVIKTSDTFDAINLYVTLKKEIIASLQLMDI